MRRTRVGRRHHWVLALPFSLLNFFNSRLSPRMGERMSSWRGRAGRWIAKTQVVTKWRASLFEFFAFWQPGTRKPGYSTGLRCSPRSGKAGGKLTYVIEKYLSKTRLSRNCQSFCPALPPSFESSSPTKPASNCPATTLVGLW